MTRIAIQKASVWVIAAVLARPAAQAQQYSIFTYAGGAIAPNTSVPGSLAALTQPSFVTADTNGNVYFANGDAIFRLDATETISRIAGTGVAGFTGDGGPATLARLQISFEGAFFAMGLAVDGAGDLFVGDAGNHRVRKVDPDGIITTIAGNGQPGSSGDGGPAVEAQLGQPSGLAVDSGGNLFIADLTYNVVRKVATTGIITTIAGMASPPLGFSGDGGPATSAMLLFPWDIALDPTGNLFIADAGSHSIRKVSPDGVITTVAGNGGVAINGAGAGYSGPASGIPLDWPTGVAADAQGNIFIADASIGVIREVTPDGNLKPVAGNGSYGFSGDGGPAAQAQLAGPWSVALDGRNNLFISDTGNRRIREVVASGTINTAAGGGTIDPLAVNGDGMGATDAQLKLEISSVTPFLAAAVQDGIAVDGNGNLFLAETGSGLIRKISAAGILTTVAGGGSCPNPNACPLGDGGPATNAYLQYPAGVAVDGKGNVFIADYGNVRVRKLSPDGFIATVAGNGTLGSTGDGGPATAAQINAQAIAIDSSGNLLIAEGENGGRVRKVSSDGIITTFAGGGACAGPSCDGGAATDAYLGATAVAVDAAGNVLIADNSADDYGCYSYIRAVSVSGTIHTVAGVPGPCQTAAGDGGPAILATLGFVSSVAVDGAGNIFLTQFNNETIRRISPDGIITTVAGGAQGYSGDGAPASLASLNAPISLATDAGGNIYLSDALNQVIRLLRPINHPWLSAVVDAASQQPEPVTPGKIVVFYGSGIGPASLVQNHPANLQGGTVFGTAAGGVTVTFDSIPAPILYASATQVAVVVPYGVAGMFSQVQLKYLGDVSNVLAWPIAAVAPSLFTLNQSGTGQAAAIDVSNGKANTAANPVRIGDYITLYATGEGQTIPAGVDGQLGSTTTHPALPVTVTVGGIPAFVQYAGGAPGQVAGLMQINVQIPAGVEPGGYVPVVLQVGNASTTAGAVWIAVSAN